MTQPHAISRNDEFVVEHLGAHETDQSGKGRSRAPRRHPEMARLTSQVERQAQILDAVLSASPEHVYMFDRAGRISYANQAAAEAHGVPVAEIIGKTSRQIGLPASITDAGMTLRRSVFASGRPVSGEARLKTVRGVRDFIYTLSPVLRPDGGVDAVVATASDITERKCAESRTEVLLEIATAVSTAADINEVLALALPRLATVVGCRGAMIFHPDPVTGHRCLLTQHGVPDEVLPFIEVLSFPPGQPFDGRMARGETVVINDMRAQKWLPAEIGQTIGLQAILAVPLRARGNRFGALILFHTQEGKQFEPSQIELCRGAARQLAVAMESAQLRERQQEEADVSAALARVGRELIAPVSTGELLPRLCALATTELDCEFSHIWLWNDERRAYTMAAAHGDSPEHLEWLRTMDIPHQWIAPVLEQEATGKIIQVGAAANCCEPLDRVVTGLGVTTGLIIELRRGNEPAGLYVAGFRKPGESLSGKQERIARGIAQLGSLALESARLLEQLEGANRMKSDFLATVSHELRTPIHIVIGYNEMLLEGAFGDMSAEQLATLHRGAASALELSGLINTILDVSRIEAGRMHIELTETDLPSLIHETDIELGELRKMRGQPHDVPLSWCIDSAPRTLITDRAKLKVVVKNLVDNALKFTDHGSVVVRIDSPPGSIVLSVTDTGSGIPAEQHEAIFGAFRQVDSSTTRRHGGVGLGLSIVRHFVEMLGGTISVDSEVGRGSTFRVQLPLRDSITTGADGPGTGTTSGSASPPAQS